MRKLTKVLAGVLVVGAGGWFAGCNSTIDQGDSAPVVMEIENLTIPAVSTSLDSTTNVCTFTISPANATFKNKPKNAGAGTSPFNDILLQNVNIAYAWDDGAVFPNRVAGVGGSVPAAGSSSGQFSVIANGDLDDPPPDNRDGHTATLTLTFHGTTVAGDPVTATTGGTLQVNLCAPHVGACCAPAHGGLCSQQSAGDCNAIGGLYGGDNSSCPVQCPQ